MNCSICQNTINTYILLVIHYGRKPFLGQFRFVGRKASSWVYCILICSLQARWEDFRYCFHDMVFQLVISLQVPEGKVVVLNFRFIDLESDNLCRYDFVDVYNGHTNGQRIGRFCGTFRPGALVSSGNKMMVQMISDANTAGNGFMAMFSAAEPNERGSVFT